MPDETVPTPTTKPWYTSKTIWTGIISGALAAYQALAPVFHWPELPMDAIIGFLAIFGISITYFRTTTNTTVTK